MKTKTCKSSCQAAQPIPLPKLAHSWLCETRRKALPTTPPSPRHKVSSQGRRQGKHLWLPQQDKSIKLSKFWFFMKGGARIFKFQRKKGLRGRVQKEKGTVWKLPWVRWACRLFSIPAIQYYNSVRKGHSSIQIGFYEIALHLDLIHIIYTQCNSSCIRNQNKLTDFHPG